MSAADLWGIMPLLILACGSVLVLVVGAIFPRRYGTSIGVATALGAGLWMLQSPPAVVTPTLGIALTPFARFLTVVFSMTAAAVLLLSHDYNRRRGIIGEEFPACVLFAAFGMTALVTSTNLLTLFLGLESFTFAFYILVASDLGNPESSEAGVKYLVIGAVSAAFVAFGISFIFAGSGTLEIASALRLAANGTENNPMVVAGWGLILVSIIFKLSLVPAHLWTPDVYQGAPTPVAAFLSAGSKGASIAFLLLLLPAAGHTEMLRAPLWWLSLLSMLVGNLAALLQANIKRMLAYSSIAHMGYVTLALLTGSATGYRAAAFYIVAYAAMSLAAFGAVAALSPGRGRDLVLDFRGIGYRRPLLGGILAMAMFALAGIPPSAGFTGKFFIFYAAIKGGEVPLAIFGILTAAVSVYYYLRVVVNLYMHDAASVAVSEGATLTETTALGAAAFVILLLGVFPGPILEMTATLFR
ncbi:MAG: NADH-quinone oxidoreductase subunit N [Geobacter sp.]|nr:NADH-quinone oxidoreductase subunit N [Geobacter sp.]